MTIPMMTMMTVTMTNDAETLSEKEKAPFSGENGAVTLLLYAISQQ